MTRASGPSVGTAAIVMADEFTSGLDRQLANKAPDNFGREGHNGVALWGKQEMSERTEEGEPSYYFRPLVV